jgi:hypothetical protein
MVKNINLSAVDVGGCNQTHMTVGKADYAFSLRTCLKLNQMG